MKISERPCSTALEQEIQITLHQALPRLSDVDVTPLEIAQLQVSVVQQALQDLRAFVEKDAAARDEHYVLASLKSFKAIAHYRLAHALHRLGETKANLALQTVARRLSECTAVDTGIEIHPAAQIGCPFVIDHGLHTLIGETADIGDHCYFLNAVTIGGRKISGSKNVTGRRHAKIGHHVEIAGHVRIFGPVTIGDHVKIQAYAKIDHDIPSHSTVKTLSSLQICPSSDNAALTVNGAIRHSDNSITVYGTGLHTATVTLHETALVRDHQKVYPAIPAHIRILSANPFALTFRVRELLQDIALTRCCVGLSSAHPSDPQKISYLYSPALSEEIHPYV